MRHLVMLVIGIVITGCATNQYDAEIEMAKYEYAAKAQAEANKPLVQVECPESGCNFNTLTVNNPTKNKVVIPTATNGWDALNKGMDTITNIAPWVATGAIAITGIKHAGSSSNSSTNHSNNSDSNSSDNSEETNTSTDNSTNTNDSYNDGSSTANATDSYNDSSDHSTTDNSNSSDNSDNSTVDNSDSSDNSDNSNNSDNSDNSNNIDDNSSTDNRVANGVEQE